MVGKTVNTRVCVNVTDTKVEENCDEIPSEETCFVKDCNATTKVVLEKECGPVADTVCNTVLDASQDATEKCKTITVTEYDEECTEAEDTVIEEEAEVKHSKVFILQSLLYRARNHLQRIPIQGDVLFFAGDFTNNQINWKVDLFPRFQNGFKSNTPKQ